MPYSISFKTRLTQLGVLLGFSLGFWPCSARSLTQKRAVITPVSITQLKTGDLLFVQKTERNAEREAIISATHTKDSYAFYHVGVLHQKGAAWFVLEAIEQGVCDTPLDTFLHPKNNLSTVSSSSQTTIVVERLKEEYTPLIPQAIAAIKAVIGAPYDHSYTAHDKAYYCSELIQEHFLKEGKPLFPYIPMTFKDAETGIIAPFWIEQFKGLHRAIPEGAPGSNPAQLSRSSKLNVIGLLSIP